MAVVVQSLPPVGMVFDNATIGSALGSGDSPTVFDWTHLNTGNTVLVPVLVGFDGDAGSLTVDATYGGVDMNAASATLVQITGVPSSDLVYCDVFYLSGIVCPTGSNPVEIIVTYENTPNQVIVGAAVSYRKVAQMINLGTTPTQPGASPSQDMPSAPGRLVAQFFFTFGAAGWTPSNYSGALRVNSLLNNNLDMCAGIYGGDVPGDSASDITAEVGASTNTVALALDMSAS